MAEATHTKTIDYDYLSSLVSISFQDEFKVPPIPCDPNDVHEWSQHHLETIRNNLIHNQISKSQTHKNDRRYQHTITESYSRCTKKQIDKVAITVQRPIDPQNPHIVNLGELTMRPQEVHTSLRLEFIKSSTNNWAPQLPVQQFVSPIFNSMNQHGTGGTKISVNHQDISTSAPHLSDTTKEKLERIRQTMTAGITSHTHAPTTNPENTSPSVINPMTDRKQQNLANVRWRFSEAVRPTKDLTEFKEIILSNMKKQSVSGPDAITLEIVLGLVV